MADEIEPTGDDEIELDGSIDEAAVTEATYVRDDTEG